MITVTLNQQVRTPGEQSTQAAVLQQSGGTVGIERKCRWLFVVRIYIRVRFRKTDIRDIRRAFLSYLPHHCKALNSLICADVPLRNYSLTHSLDRQTYSVSVLRHSKINTPPARGTTVRTILHPARSHLWTWAERLRTSALLISTCAVYIDCSIMTLLKVSLWSRFDSNRPISTIRC